MENILGQIIVTAIKTAMVLLEDLKRAISDSTIMEKNISFPTDTKLLNRAREKLVDLASGCDLKLRQTHARVGRFATLNAGWYANAKQFKRMRKEIKKLKNFLGRTVRDVEQQVECHCQLSA